MTGSILSARERAVGALWGLFIGDALAMPVHWYYDRQALSRDYGEVRDFMAPRHPHPDSILHRSHYTPANADADILHDQARYWGQPGIHYHQHLAAGENTLNLQLVRLMLERCTTAREAIRVGGEELPLDQRSLTGLVAAERLGVGVSTLYRRLKALSIRVVE